MHCEINVDDCNPFTDPVTKEPKCFNKGKCVDRVGGYHCICPAGYVGERCEGDVNECLSNPCDPRGTHSCIQLTNNYRCECRTGYTGKQLVGRGGWGVLSDILHKSSAYCCNCGITIIYLVEILLHFFSPFPFSHDVLFLWAYKDVTWSCRAKLNLQLVN